MQAEACKSSPKNSIQNMDIKKSDSSTTKNIRATKEIEIYLNTT